MAAPATSIMRRPMPPTGLFEYCKRLRRNPQIRSLIRKTFVWFQQRGINITPRHFYWPIPNVAELAQREWHFAESNCGLDFGLERQKALALDLARSYARELGFPDRQDGNFARYHRDNGFFETVDADIAYAMVRRLKPRRIIEVGCGFSTRVMAAAVAKNAAEGCSCHFISIDPFAEPRLAAELRGLDELVVDRVQSVPAGCFEELGNGDILFIDSSHVVAIGSDVVQLYLNVLPRLKPGVVVHIHDIFLPFDYPRPMVLDGLCFWTEQYLLQAFLQFNSAFRILWGSSAMQYYAPDVLDTAFPWWRGSWTRLSSENRQFIPTLDGCRVWPSSFWMRRES